MGKTIVLVGGMASGKTTLAKALEQKGFRRIITYTTRSIRPKEHHDIDYHFISDYEFELRTRDGFFAEVTAYNTTFGYCRYGSAKHDYNSEDDTVIVLNPRGVINLSEDAFIVWLDLDPKVLADRAKIRGDAPEEIERRIKDDALYFEEMAQIKSTNLYIDKIMHVDELVNKIIKEVKER